jgi:hypothetical protein
MRSAVLEGQFTDFAVNHCDREAVVLKGRLAIAFTTV